MLFFLNSPVKIRTARNFSEDDKSFSASAVVEV
jgi:hypothetical protein